MFDYEKIERDLSNEENQPEIKFTWNGKTEKFNRGVVIALDDMQCNGVINIKGITEIMLIIASFKETFISLMKNKYSFEIDTINYALNMMVKEIYQESKHAKCEDLDSFIDNIFNRIKKDLKETK